MVHVFEEPDDEPSDAESAEVERSEDAVQREIYSYRFTASIILIGENGEKDKIIEHEVEFTRETAQGFQWMAHRVGLSTIEEVYDALVRLMISANPYEKERFTNAALFERVTIFREFLQQVDTNPDTEESGPWSKDDGFNNGRIWEPDAEEE